MGEWQSKKALLKENQQLAMQVEQFYKSSANFMEIYKQLMLLIDKYEKKQVGATNIIFWVKGALKGLIPEYEAHKAYQERERQQREDERKRQKDQSKETPGTTQG